jgi:hypothetical protein
VRTIRRRKVKQASQQGTFVQQSELLKLQYLTMVVQFKEEVEEIPNSAGPNDEIDGFWPDEYDNDASVSFLDMFGNDADTPDDSSFEELNGNIDDDYFAQYFP